MAGYYLENLLSFVGVKLRPAGAHQDGFSPEAKRQHFAQQGVGVEDHLRTVSIAAGIGGDQPGQVRVQRGNYLIVDTLVGGSRRQLLAGG